MSETNVEEQENQVLSPEDQRALDYFRQKNEKQTIVSYDTIKLKDSEKKVVINKDGIPIEKKKGEELLVGETMIPRGHWMIEAYDGSKPEGERKTFKDIGENPEVVILHRAYVYSYYKDKVGLVAFTTDIQGFSEDDMVQLYSKKDGEKMRMEYTAGFPSMKQYLEDKYVTKDEEGSTKKLMTFQNLLYVLFEGKIYRMFVSNASTAGIAEGEVGGDFKRPQPFSLLSFIETTKREPGSAMQEFICELGSVFKDDVEQPFYIRTFTNKRKIDNMQELAFAIRAARTIELEAMNQQKTIIEKKHIGELKEQAMLPEGSANGGYQQRIKVEDLPF